MQAIFRQRIGVVLFQRSKIVRGAHGLDFVKLTADGFSHGHGGVAGAHQEVGAWFGERSTPVGGGNGGWSRPVSRASPEMPTISAAPEYPKFRVARDGQ